MHSSGLQLNNAADTEQLLQASENGAVTAFYDGSAKLTTTNTGIDVTGNRIDISNTSLADTGERASLQWDANADLTFQGRASDGTFKANWYRIEASASDGLADAHRFYTDSSVERMSITSTGIDVTGSINTVLSVDGTTEDVFITGTVPALEFVESDSGGSRMRMAWNTSGSFSPTLYQSLYGDSTTTYGGINIQTRASDGSGNQVVYAYDPINDRNWWGTRAAGDVAMQLQSDGTFNVRGGDVVFENSAATSDDFFWDASSSRLGLGTTSPSHEVHLLSASPQIRLQDDGGTNTYGDMQFNGTALSLITRGGASSHGVMRFQSSDGTDNLNRMEILSNGDIRFYDDTETEGLRWDASARRLGLNTISPTTVLDVTGGAIVSPTGVNYQNYTSVGDLQIADTASTGLLIHSGTTSSGYVTFGDGAVAGRIQYDHSADEMYISTNNSIAATIDSSGNLLVGKASTAFGTQGIALNANGVIDVTKDGDAALFLNRLSSDGTLLEFYRGASSFVGAIAAVGGDLRIGGLDDNHAGLRFAASEKAMLPVLNSDGSLDDGNTDLGASNARFDDVNATNGTIQTSDRNEKQDIEELTEAEQRVAVACKGLLRKFRWKSAVEEKGDDARIHFGIIAQDLQDAFTAEGLDAGRYGMFINSTWTDEETGEERSRMGVRYSELLAFIISAI